jgi:hypothetical protein
LNGVGEGKIYSDFDEGYDQQKDDFLFNVFDVFEYFEVIAVLYLIDRNYSAPEKRVKKKTRH